MINNHPSLPLFLCSNSVTILRVIKHKDAKWTSIPAGIPFSPCDGIPPFCSVHVLLFLFIALKILAVSRMQICMFNKVKMPEDAYVNTHSEIVSLCG